MYQRFDLHISTGKAYSNVISFDLSVLPAFCHFRVVVYGFSILPSLVYAPFRCQTFEASQLFQKLIGV